MKNPTLAYLQAGKVGRAAGLVIGRLATSRASLPKQSPQPGFQLAQTALSLLKSSAFTEAEPIARESPAIREKTQPDSWLTFNTKCHGPNSSGRSRQGEPALNTPIEMIDTAIAKRVFRRSEATTKQ